MNGYVALPELTETVPCLLCARQVHVESVFGEDPAASVCDGCSVATSFVPTGAGDTVTLLAALYGSSERWDILGPAFAELADILTGLRTWQDAGLTPAEATAGGPFRWLDAATVRAFARAAAAEAIQSEADRNRAAAEASRRSRAATAEPQSMSAGDWNTMRSMSHATAARTDSQAGVAGVMTRTVG